MVSILFLTHKLPDPADSGMVSIYHFIKELKESGHKVYLFSTPPTKYNKRLEELSDYCNGIKIINDPSFYNLYNQVLLVLHPKFLLRHIQLKYPITLLDIYYNPQIERELNEFVKNKQIDLIFVTRPMAIYALSFENIPKIIQPYDAVSEWHRQVSNVSRNILLKILYKFTSYLTQIYEKTIYPKFDKVLVVTEVDKKLLKQLAPELDVYVLPNGVDVSYFSPADITSDDPSLVFVSSMSGEPTVSNVLWFYNNVFQKIKEKSPNIKLYLVGKNPAPEIRELEKDSNVIVTGTVDDVRPYVYNATIVVIPMIAGTGIKNKTLEALSMGKAIVSTSIGVQGIAGTHKKHFIVTDKPNEFADFTVFLIYSPKYRRKMGHFARDLIVSKYTWSRIAEILAHVLELT